MQWLLVFVTVSCGSPCGPANSYGLQSCNAVMICKTHLDTGRVTNMPDEETCERIRNGNLDMQCWAKRETKP